VRATFRLTFGSLQSTLGDGHYCKVVDISEAGRHLGQIGYPIFQEGAPTHYLWLSNRSVAMQLNIWNIFPQGMSVWVCTIARTTSDSPAQLG